MKFLAGLFLVLSAMLLPNAASAAASSHKVAIHVDQNDPQVMNMALNNAKNLAAYYSEKGEDVAIELVTYGPGLMMLREDKSPVKDRISTMALELPNITFSACNNTIKGMTKKEGHEIKLISEAGVVPSGVVRLMELQEQGYAYVRP
ncbi:DsrE family protein [uncultured Roseibium sp.]|uniref:DsrE family protein n=1 Tax=uncultured Roseibium sp. TaxID=1936171 RepID=UPI003217CFE6